MPVESAADLATMFDAEEFAEAAGYTAPGGGAAVDCLVVVDRGQGRSRFDAGEAEAVGSDRRLWAQASELAEVARGGSFAIWDPDLLPDVKMAIETYAVLGQPQLDELAALWSVQLTIID